MVNPYQSPEPITETTPPRSWRPLRLVRIVFCLVNFAFAGLFAASGIAAIWSGERAMGALAAIVFTPIFVVYAICEGLAIVRPAVERVLGNLNFVAAAIVVVGMVCNTLEAISQSAVARDFLSVFLPIAGAIAAYLIACGWVRVTNKFSP